MMFSFPLFTVLNTITGANANSSGAMPLSVQVSCANVHMDDVSPKALAFGAKALEVSFNNVLQGANGMTLAEVTATPSEIETLFKDSGKGVRGGRCKNCGTDDEFDAEQSLFFAGDLGRCKNCGTDDGTMQLFGEAKMQLWQQELTAIFAMAPYDSLSKAEGCRIAMAPRSDEVKRCKNCGTDDALVQSEAVTIDIQCENLDLKDMPVSALSVTTKALAESFDAIHSAKGNQLSGIVLVGPRLSFSGDADNKSLKRCKNCGTDDDAWIVPDATASLGRCKNCGTDDRLTSEYAIEFAAVKRCKNCGTDDATLDAATMATNRAWEELFAAKMMKAGLHTGVCKLAMKEDATA